MTHKRIKVIENAHGSWVSVDAVYDDSDAWVTIVVGPEQSPAVIELPLDKADDLALAIYTASTIARRPRGVW